MKTDPFYQATVLPLCNKAGGGGEWNPEFVQTFDLFFKQDFSF